MAKRYTKKFKQIKKEIKKGLGDIEICLTIADLGNMAGVTDAFIIKNIVYNPGTERFI